MIIEVRFNKTDRSDIKFRKGFHGIVLIYYIQSHEIQENIDEI